MNILLSLTMMNNYLVYLLLHTFIVQLGWSTVSGFVLSLTTSYHAPVTFTSIKNQYLPGYIRLLSKQKDAIDVEVEQMEKSNTSMNVDKKREAGIDKNNLMSIPFEFIDPDSPKRFIECRIKFVLEMDSIQYWIGTPVDTQVAIYCEGRNIENSGAQSSKDKTLKASCYFIDPDNDTNLELMEIAAAEFSKVYGEEIDIIFKRTPRTLTIEVLNTTNSDGKESFNPITSNDWLKDYQIPDDQQPKNVLADSILDEIERVEDDEEDDKYFDDFFKKELGPNYKSELLVPDDDVDKKVMEMMHLFNIPGIGTQRQNEEGISELLEDIFNGGDLQKASEHKDENEVETAVRLLGFTGPDGKPYSLVKMIQPMVLVAREAEGLEPDQRLLLSADEADKIIPKLEKQFIREFEEAGFSITP
jgi:hypothetical protein